MTKALEPLVEEEASGVSAHVRLATAMKVLSILAINFALFLAGTCDVQAKGPCEGEQATLRCLKENFRELYRKEYKRFWDILSIAEDKALSCRFIAETTDFLDVAGTIEGNADVSEYFSEVLEMKLIPANPKCFLDALLVADEKSRKRIIRNLRTPTFDEKNKVREILSKYRVDQKYEELLKPYFKD